MNLSISGIIRILYIHYIEYHIFSHFLKLKLKEWKYVFFVKYKEIFAKPHFLFARCTEQLGKVKICRSTRINVS